MKIRASSVPDWFVPIYAFAYRSAMRALHRFGRHWFKRCYPDGDVMLWCHWCGERRVLAEGGEG